MTIRSLAVTLRILTWMGAILVVLMPALAWLGPADGLLATRNALLAASSENGDGNRLLFAALLFPPYVAVAWGLVQLSGFCDRLARGDHFSRAAATALKRFGWSLVAASVLLPVTRLAARAYLSDGTGLWDLVQGLLRTMPLLATALGLIVGLIVIVFASILEQAKALAEENARFV
jgi:hypothetical protein